MQLLDVERLSLAVSKNGNLVPDTFLVVYDDSVTESVERCMSRVEMDVPFLVWKQISDQNEPCCRQTSTFSTEVEQMLLEFTISLFSCINILRFKVLRAFLFLFVGLCH